MAFSISDFNAVISRNGLAKSNLFFANITFPGGLLQEGTMNSQDMSYYCMNMSLPSLEVSATPIKVRGYGPAEKRPTDMEFSPVTATFMVDANFKVLNTFHKWMQKVVHYDASGGITTQDGKKVYEFGYKDDYAGSMTAIVFSQNSQRFTYQYNFGGLWPVSVGEIQPAWENGAEIMTLTVTFSYSEFSVTGSVQGDVAAEIVSSVSATNPGSVTTQEVLRATQETIAAREAAAAEADTQTATEQDVAQAQENQSATRSATIKGFTRGAVENTPEYQAILDDNLSRMPGYPDNIKSSLVRRAKSVSDMEYRAGLVDGTIVPPEDSGIVVTPATEPLPPEG